MAYISSPEVLGVLYLLIGWWFWFDFVTNHPEAITLRWHAVLVALPIIAIIWLPFFISTFILVALERVGSFHVRKVQSGTVDKEQVRREGLQADPK